MIVARSTWTKVQRLKDALAKIPNVQKEPAPDVEIIDFNSRSGARGS